MKRLLILVLMLCGSTLKAQTITGTGVRLKDRVTITAGNVNSTTRYDVDGDHGTRAITTTELGLAIRGTLPYVSGTNIGVSSGTISLTATPAVTTLTVTATTILNGLKYPTADGSANQVLKTNGSGVLSFTTITGGVSSLTLVGAPGLTISGTNGAISLTLLQDLSETGTPKFSSVLGPNSNALLGFDTEGANDFVILEGGAAPARLKIGQDTAPDFNFIFGGGSQLASISSTTGSTFTGTLAIITSTAGSPIIQFDQLSRITLSGSLGTTNQAPISNSAGVVTWQAIPNTLTIGGDGLAISGSTGNITLTNSGVTLLTLTGGYGTISTTTGAITLTLVTPVASLTLGGYSLLAQTGTTGALSLVPTTTGSLQLSVLGVNTTTTTAAMINILAGATTTGGIRITSPASYSGNYWAARNSGGTDMVYVFGDGSTGATLVSRNSASFVGDFGNASFSYLRVYGVATVTNAVGPRVGSGSVLNLASAGEVIAGSAGLMANTSNTINTASNLVGVIETVSGLTTGTSSMHVSHLLGVGTTTGALSSTSAARGSIFAEGMLELTSTATTTRGGIIMRDSTGVRWLITIAPTTGLVTSTTNF